MSAHFLRGRTRRGPGFVLGLAALAPLVLASTRPVHADDTVPTAVPTPAPPEGDYTTHRLEPAGFPLIGGSSDIGFLFGAAGTLSHFQDGIRPYAWNMDLVAAASVKGGPRGLEIAERELLWDADFVGLWGGKLRLKPQVYYRRIINVGYYGLGNATNAVVPLGYYGPAGRYFQFIQSTAAENVQARYAIDARWSAIGALADRYVEPTPYTDSKLSHDALAHNPDGSPLLRGTRRLSLPRVAVGMLYDSRDDEIFTRRGSYDEAAVSYVQGVPTNQGVQYGEAQVMVAGFLPIGPLVLAERIVGDLQFGHVPFYDLITDGPVAPVTATGGPSAIRGVPLGRYAGTVKVYGNSELRAMFFRFSLLRQKFAVGGDALVDVGRSWLGTSFHDPRDGKGLGLKYGAGGGLYLRWGQAALFRVEAAYSPDAAAENPRFPVGLYVEDSTMF